MATERLGEVTDGQTWIEVSRGIPCDRCGKDTWCAYSDDGNFIICRRVDNGHGKVDSDGQNYYVYRTDEPFQETSLPSSHKSKAAPKADPDTLNSVYSYLLDDLELSKCHQANLKCRGLADKDIDRNTYKSIPCFEDKADIAD